jgi:hypothetical protein
MNGTNAGYASNVAPTEVRQPEVSGEMDRLAIQCETLDKQLHQLEQRLEPVLAQRSDGESANTKNPEPVRVPLAQSLHDRVYHLSLMSDRLQSTINRIEL